ncbi:MAG: DNA adenine methylase [Planctomycetes bacterium]|nr:DNA adenine methylase [Planctomycetota bacterium]
MRLIGNKSRLLGEIEAFLVERGVLQGTFIDIFTGTASVARHFKARGFRVLANDWMSACFTQAVAAVEVSRPPPFKKLLHAHREVFLSKAFRDSLMDGGPAAAGPAEGEEFEWRWEGLAEPPDFDLDPEYLRSLCSGSARRSGRRRTGAASALPLRLMVHFLNRFVEPSDGLIFRNFAPGGRFGRRYFRDEHARKIDGLLAFLRGARQAGDLSRGELHLLLSSLIDAADRRANISGTYGAFLKGWQTNTRGELLLEVPRVVGSPVRGHRAYRQDSNLLIRKLRGEVLYIDPPYNHRQYAANYHLLEILAEHHRVPDLEAYESALYGKTGLRPYQDLYSSYCVRKHPRRKRPDVLQSMRDLILSANVRHVLVSYNEEGLLGREDLGAVLAEFSGSPRFDFQRNFREINCRRFRSDRDRGPENGNGAARRYRVLEGKGKDEIGEWLLYAARRP